MMVFKECFEVGELIGKHITDALRIQDYDVTFNVSRSQHQRIMEILGVQRNSTKKVFRDYSIHVNGYANKEAKTLQEQAPGTQENAIECKLTPFR